MGREVSESCMDSLLTEMVSSYCDRFYTNLIKFFFFKISINCINFSNWALDLKEFFKEMFYLTVWLLRKFRESKDTSMI